MAQNGAADDAACSCRFEPGDRCGCYRIVRLLGRGAAGEVYEAEDSVTLRRLALKILHTRLRRPADRERFLREGRAAAAIAHPNVVFVYGASEIAGLAVLAMELVGGETLASRVERVGPLPSDAAVDLVLQVVDGLEATAAAGLRHGDVKPSNCFVTGDRSVKIGDFGMAAAAVTGSLSIAEAQTGFTPEFAAPEQVSGSAGADLRTDIHAVGATLYFLLTGRPPFTHATLDGLLAQVVARTVTWPLVPAVAPRLRDIVDRCLHKRCEGRFASYADLRTALIPFSTRAEEPATLATTMCAFALDGLFLLPLLGPVAAAVIVTGVIKSPFELALLGSAALAIYVCVCCRISDGTLGMRRCGIARSATRVRFVRARRREAILRQTATPAQLEPSAPVSMGPFELRGKRIETEEGVLWDGWDPLLRRRVWLHQRLAGAASLARPAQRANRPTRLRWLQSHRSEPVAWDAFDAPDGERMSARQNAAWPEVASWLADLAAEIEARRLEADPPRLAWNRIWITAAGRAILLDLPVAPDNGGGLQSGQIGSRDERPQPWLARVGRAALGPREVPLPVSACGCLDRLADDRFASLDEAGTVLKALASTPDRVTTGARANTLMLSALGLALTIALTRAGLAALPAGVPAFVRALTPLPIVTLLCGAAALISSILAGGGLWLFANRIAVVTTGGTPASPVRRAARALLAWSWLIVPALGQRPVLPPQFLVLLPLALWHAARNPSEGLVDRVMATRLVPR
jgi:tRNA A-37 threonylcarbamoyl transferase component Bud32